MDFLHPSTIYNAYIVTCEKTTMTSATAAVFMSGNSQAIRLPKSFRVSSSRVQLKRQGNSIVITEKPLSMKEFLAKLPVIQDAPLAPDDGPEEPIQAW